MSGSASGPAPEPFTFHLPPAGNLSVTLRDESAPLYRFLRDSGEVARLQRLDHLGLMRAAWEGAHHPRWEHVRLIWALIERAKATGKVHLGVGPKLSNGYKVSSGEELLKCWTLLLTAGHLTWTFAAERALLMELSLETAARADFMAPFPALGLEEWARLLIEESRSYQFSQALAFHRIAGLKASGAGSPHVPLWTEMMRTYEATGDQSAKVKYLRGVFRSLRRAAYLALDSHYTPSALTLDLMQVLSDPDALARIAHGETQGGDDELRALDEHLYRDIYLSRSVLEQYAAVDRDLHSRIRRSLRSKGFAVTVQALAQGDIQAGVQREAVEFHVRVAMWPGRANARLLGRMNVRQEQARAGKIRRLARHRIRPVWWGPPYSN